MTFRVIPVPGFGAEDVVVVPAGRYEGAVYTGTEDGAIHRIAHDGHRVDTVAHTADVRVNVKNPLTGDVQMYIVVLKCLALKDE